MVNRSYFTLLIGGPITSIRTGRGHLVRILGMSRCHLFWGGNVMLGGSGVSTRGQRITKNTIDLTIHSKKQLTKKNIKQPPIWFSWLFINPHFWLLSRFHTRWAPTSYKWTHNPYKSPKINGFAWGFLTSKNHRKKTPRLHRAHPGPRAKRTCGGSTFGSAYFLASYFAPQEVGWLVDWLVGWLIVCLLVCLFPCLLWCWLFFVVHDFPINAVLECMLQKAALT